MSAVALLVSVLAMAGPGTQRPEVTWNNPETAPTGLQHFALESKAIGKPVGYNVWLPPSYGGGNKRYPVIYFLHGAGGNENSDAASFSSMVKAQIDAKAIPEAICVFPNGGMSGYVDRDGVNGEFLIVKELIPKIDSQFRTIASRDGRVIAGYSMGGGGAIRLAVKHPDLFSAAAGWAAALHNRGPENRVANIVRENREKIRGKVRLLMIVGDKDLTFDSHATVVEALKETSIPHTYKVLPGVDHNLGVYHRETGTEFVRFLGAGFRA